MQQYSQPKQAQNFTKKLTWAIVAGFLLVTLFIFSTARRY
jgi:hypothetical protein